MRRQAIRSRYWEEEVANNVNIDTATAGATITFAPTKVNEFRANWSRATGSDIHHLTDFHGAIVPSNSVIFPPPYSPNTGQALVFFPDGEAMEVRAGALSVNTQRQLNFVDTFSWTLGTHQLKLGIDYRRLRPTTANRHGLGSLPREPLARWLPEQQMLFCWTLAIHSLSTSTTTRSTRKTPGRPGVDSRSPMGSDGRSIPPPSGASGQTALCDRRDL